MGEMIGKAAFVAATQATARATIARRLHWFNLPATGQRVMATPPTITAGSASAMTSPFLVPSASGNGGQNSATNVFGAPFVYTRAGLVKGGASIAPTFDNITVNNVPNYSSAPVGVSFVHTGQAFEIWFGANATAYFAVKVDDAYAEAGFRATASGATYVKYDFGSSATRRIDIVGHAISFIGVNIGQTDSLDPAPVRGPRCIVVTDSFGGASTGSSTLKAFPSIFADAMGWDDVWGSGVGGTGYLASNGGTTPTFRARIAHDAIGYAPDVVLIAGSVNDDGFGAAAIGVEADLLYKQLRAGLPNAMIFAGDHAKQGVNTYGAGKLDKTDAMKAAAAANGVIWVNPIELPLGFGDATVGIGGTLYNAHAAGATQLVTVGHPQPASTIEIGSGATRERVQAKSFANSGGGVYTVPFDGTLRYAHATGETWRQVGNSYITGRGYAGGATGFGNADLYVSADQTHPVDAGAAALGRTYAMLMRQAMRGL